ncbi:MAG: DUF3365 domain-containing protein [Geothrix sp.]|uniref:ATP-binding response regulator n=1 Tax=Geothrix sp. TaxID=1962974 RepID=UPI00183C1F7E|nr:ATP-binding protein [Geothrix sp.]NWJ42379.1 DUF3365 domain-containing protein [Geothrix sp.]WIL19654.1 MAG: DUF3365 domain-containing protein [Geothrix sp.]
MSLRSLLLPAVPGTFRAFFALFGAWSLVVLAALGADMYFSIREDRVIAYNRASDSYRKDLAYRRWAAERGGVYVPKDARTPPNPHLAHLPHRDVTTTDGKALTLVNPAYMTRMVHELAERDYGLKAHITSLNPIRSENAPDPWERRALESFERGGREQSEVLQQDGKPVLRFMGAFLVEESCLKCHGQQGYKPGEVRGGISVTVPVGSGATVFGLTHESISVLSVLALWLMGGLGILAWVRRLVHASRDQLRMMKEMEDGSNRFHQLFQSSPAPMIIHRNGRFTDVNLAAARLLDADDPSQLIGLEILSFIHPQYRYLVSERIHTVEQNEETVPAIEEVFLTYRGREVWVEVQTAYIDLPGGPAILVFAQDLSERRRAEEERRKMEAEIQHAQKLESLGSLAGGIAHDMNNVLGAILGMATLLQLKREGDEALLKSLRTIENAASRGRDLVKGLTDFARKGLQQAQRLDLNTLLREELDLLVRTSRQRFTFEVELDETLPPIMGERSSLGSAFMNLAVNAFDSMPRGGTFRVRTFQEGDQVCLEVADTGEGIPADILSRVTDPFFTTKPQGRGTGLGLAMVYGTVKAHGGSLDIQSEVGKGTRIRLHLPALVTRTLSGEPEDLPVAHPDHPLRILLVDDDELIRDILPPMLEQLGHRVETTSSGLEAVRRLGAGLEVDLVILDHNMPGMTGAETLPRIFQLRPAVRVLIATGFLDTDLKILLADFPSVSTLQKPFSVVELRKMLQAISAELEP